LSKLNPKLGSFQNAGSTNYYMIRFDYRALGSSRKLEGTAEHLIDGSEKRICRLSFEF